MEFSRQELCSGLPFLFQGIFPTQGLNLGLLHCRQILHCLSHWWFLKPGHKRHTAPTPSPPASLSLKKLPCHEDTQGAPRESQPAGELALPISSHEQAILERASSPGQAQRALPPGHLGCSLHNNVARMGQLSHSRIPDSNHKATNVCCFKPLSFEAITNTTLLC